MKHNITFLLVVAGFVNSASQLIPKSLPIYPFIETTIDCTIVPTGEMVLHVLTSKKNHLAKEVREDTWMWIKPGY